MLADNTKMDFEENVGGGWDFIGLVRIATGWGHGVVSCLVR
jgi:hypothetical protein